MRDSIQKTIDDLKKLQQNVSEISGTHDYSFKELFNDDFISQHSKFKTISELLEPSGLDFSSQEAFRNINVEELDKYISENTDFSSWEEMKSAATHALLSKKVFNI